MPETVRPSAPTMPAPGVADGPHWIEGLATLSGLRDRDRLAAGLVEVLHGLLQPLQVQVWRVAGPEDDRRWLPQARVLRGQYQPGPAPGTLDWHALQPLTELPRWPESVPDSGTEADQRCFLLGSDPARSGALRVQSLRPLTSVDERLITGVLRMYDNVLALLDYSERDELTGLLNRKTFDESFMRHAHGTQAAARAVGAERRNQPGAQAWLGVIDIDHFKRVNDTYGHLIGDEVLLLAARLMRGGIRLDDQLYRFGGEEFVALMRCADASQAKVAFERMRQRVAASVFPRVGQITLSIGFTRVRPADTPSAAFERADRAVYYAKQHGRNQVHDHGALVAAGLLREEQHNGGVELF